jgi:hypothetical protein
MENAEASLLTPYGKESTTVKVWARYDTREVELVYI